NSEILRAPRERLYAAAELQPLLSPRSIAVVGVSSNGRGFGHRALSELLTAGCDRPIYVVHARFATETAIDGTIGVVSIEDLPEPVDCVLVAVPSAGVIPVVQAAAARGCRSALIFSAGFGEVEGGQDERILREIAERSGMRIAGPNTAGILNYRERLPL